MNTAFYHGTSIGTGLEEGDHFDPRRSEFEQCIWGTASLAYAKYWAGSRDACYDAGEIVYEMALEEGAKVKTANADLSDVNEVIEKAKAEGFDAVIFEDGEDNAPMIAILNGYTARAKAI